MKAEQLLTKLNSKINTLKMRSIANKPEIFLVLGIGGVITGTALACIATTKLPAIKAKKEEELENMHARLDSEDNANLPDIKKETTSIYLKTGARYAGVYAPSVVVTGVSVSFLVASNIILRKRIIGVSAAYAAISQSFKDYRGRVVERYGEDIDKELRYGVRETEVITTVTDDNGKTKKKREKIKVTDPSSIGDFARVFDSKSIGWSKDPQTTLTFLKCQQTASTQLLREQGYLFLNDVYEKLGFPKIPEGQIVGWIYDEKNPMGDNYVDFGIYDITKESVRDFINGFEKAIVLDFNHDGPILQYMHGASAVNSGKQFLSASASSHLNLLM